MTERLVVDADAANDFIRQDENTPPPLREARHVLLPVTVVGELFAGAELSRRVAENLATVEELIARCVVIYPDTETARVYGSLRRSERTASMGRVNDLWIAAICIRNDVPLLTGDRGFDVLTELKVIHY